jgi:hypothetical protein
LNEREPFLALARQLILPFIDKIIWLINFLNLLSCKDSIVHGWNAYDGGGDVGGFLSIFGFKQHNRK